MNIDLDNAIAKFQEGSKDFAVKYMTENGEMPMFVAFLAQNDNKEFVTVVAPHLGNLHTKDDKPLFIAAVKKAIEAIKPVALVFITEAWIVKRTKEQGYDPSIPPSMAADREEVVMVQLETYKNAGLHIYDIIRHTNGDISLEYDAISSNSKIEKENVDGSFSNLLKENYDKFYKELVESINKNQN